MRGWDPTFAVPGFYVYMWGVEGAFLLWGSAEGLWLGMVDPFLFLLSIVSSWGVFKGGGRQKGNKNGKIIHANEWRCAILDGASH